MRSLKSAYTLIFFTAISFFFAGSAFSQVEFIQNKGQWDSRIKFKTDAGSGSCFLQEKGFTITQSNTSDLDAFKRKRHGKLSEAETKTGAGNKIRSHAYSVTFVNANTPEIVPDKALPTFNNYFIGNDKSKWASECRLYLGITYKNVYPGIDVRFYSDAGSNLKYDFIVHPGGDVNKIAMKYTGADKLEVRDRELVISTLVGENKQLRPYTYQVVDNARQELECKYVVDGDVVRFKVKNPLPGRTLIIDPTQIFFSYSGSTADNWGFTATYGADGSFYGGGIAWDNGFPASPGAYNGAYSGAFDISIIKLSPFGQRRLYATYIGGNAEDQPHSLIEDPQGNLIIGGRSKSSDYPVTAPIYGKGGGWDIIVTKLNAAGSQLIGSMKIGGTESDGINIQDEAAGATLNSLKRNYGDDARSEVILDAANNIYLASCTQSTSSSTPADNFPTTAGAFQRTPGKKQDGVVLKIDPSCNSVIFSTLLGGKEDDAAYVLKIGNNNNIYVAGGTASDDLPGVKSSGVIQSAFSGGPCDGFVIELNNTGGNALSGTYLGTPSADQVYGIEVDKFGFIYVMGLTGGQWPVINAAYSNPNSKQFVSKLEPDLSAYVYSTVFGSGSPEPNISPTAFLVDRCENVYVSGWGGKSNNGFSKGNTKGMPTTPNAIKPNTDASGSDFYFIVIKKDAASLLYGTFFGQEDPPLGVTDPDTFGDHVDGGTSRFDRNGVIYQAMCANCFKQVSFLGSPDAWSRTNQAISNGKCNLGMLKIEMNFSGVRASLRASINGVPYDTVGCVPLTVNFSDTLQLGKLYYWSYGDGFGDTTTNPDISHTYTTTGTFRVRLISIDSSTCNISDTVYTNIKVGSNKASLDFVASKIPPCTNLSYNFTNTSSATSGAFRPDAFTWDFGDNTPVVVQGKNPPVVHTFAGPGTYLVKLSLDDTTFCNSPVDTLKTVRISPQVTALFTTPPAGCVPYTADFVNNSLGGLHFVWNFGDGGTSTDDSPSHLYNTPGTFTVKLFAFDSTSCNLVDSTSQSITVSSIPTAAFNYNPNPPQENTITNFINQSTGATKYMWNFGDGDSSIDVNPSHIFPETKKFTVCLQAINAAGCFDDTCMDVEALIKPLADVPSAFTPGRFGTNSHIKVEGFGISQMHWLIYNRWGQKVYESNNRKSAWDGTFNGKLQPVDVYTYTLDVTFSDGKKLRRTGDITLLR
ncbi:MAG: PKD domain-containing protein [Ginsengibacter sp.]